MLRFGYTRGVKKPALGETGIYRCTPGTGCQADSQPHMD
jgi:hypothetical protein